MPKIVVSSLRAIPEALALHRPSHMVSVIEPEAEIERPPAIAPEAHLHLRVHDIAGPIATLTAPERHHVDALLAFLARWPQDRPLLVHCWAGISRSTAAALVALAALRPAACEIAMAQALRHASPTAKPNPRLIALGDEALGRGGRLRHAVHAMGANSFGLEGPIAAVPLDGHKPRG